MIVPRLILFTSLLVIVAACAGDNAQEPEEAKALWSRIHAEDYRSFARAPGYEMRQPSNTSHSAFSEIFINDVFVLALGDVGIEKWPDGALIVKDGYDSDGNHSLIAAMEKRAGEWFYVEWVDPKNPDAKFSGQPSVCVDCHNRGSDGIQAFELP